MKQQLLIDIPKHFSPEPIGRYRSDSPVSGEVFRENILAPALKDAKNLKIVLDGAEGYGSSFLEEAFGGLIRHHAYSAQDVLNRIEFVSVEDPTLIEEIAEYLRDAEEAKTH